jgi:hypothetical protein
MTIAMAGLNAVGQMAAINEQNAAAERNRQISLQAMNEEQAQNAEQYVEQQRSLIQSGFDAVLQGREDEATAYTSALQNGVSGLSVRAVLRDARQTAGRNTSRNQQEQNSLNIQTSRAQRGSVATARGRINQVAPTSFNMGDLGVVLSPILRSQMG